MAWFRSVDLLRRYVSDVVFAFSVLLEMEVRLPNGWIICVYATILPCIDSLIANLSTVSVEVRKQSMATYMEWFIHSVIPECPQSDSGFVTPY